jgi:tetratricopeptide (TPR) repeat protein
VGTRLSVVTVIGVVLLAAPAVAQTPPPGSPAEAAAKAQELYRAGDFGNALPLFEQAHQLEPANFDYQWGLAQTLRQTSQCEKALLHYQSLREAAPDPRTARDVRDQMALCPGGAIEEEAPPPPPPPPPRVEASASGGTISRKTWLMAAGAGAGLALSAAFFMDYHSSKCAADAAARYDDHEKFSARADRMLIASGVAAVVGVGLAVVSIRRFKNERKSDLAIVPRTDGGAVVWSGSW